MNPQETVQKGRGPKPRYELTLAEFPVALLSKKPRQEFKPLEYKDMIEGKDGKPIQRTWKVVPSAEYGFGGPTTIGTLFEIFQIWHEQGFKDRHIMFGSIYKMIERKFLRSRSNQNYRSVERDLECLAHLTFDAINAFWDNEKRAYVDIKGFKLFDYVALYKDSPTGQHALPFSHLMASEILWDSVNKRSFFPVGIRREMFHSFKPLEQRLALYLEKVFRSQHTHRRDIFKLAEQLPIQSQTAKHIKSTLRRACGGLMGKGYDRLAGHEFEKSADRRSENVVFHRAGNLELPFSPQKPKVPPKREDKDPHHVEALVMDMLEALEDEESRGFYTLVARRVPSTTIHRALSEIRLEARESGIRNKGAIFTVKIKRYAKEQGIALGLKEPERIPEKGKREKVGARDQAPRSEAQPRAARRPSMAQERNRVGEEEEKKFEAFYQALSQEKRAEVDARAEEMLPGFLKTQMKLADQRGEESYGVRMSIKYQRHMILRKMMRAGSEAGR